MFKKDKEKKQQEQKEMQADEKKRNKLKILIIILASAIITAVLVLLIIFAIKQSSILRTDYGSLKNIDIDSEKTFTLSVSAPYFENDMEYSFDEQKKVVLKDEDGKEYYAAVKQITYTSLTNEEMQTGTVEISFEVKDEFAFEDGKTYTFKMEDATVFEKESKTSVGAIKTAFKAEKLNGDSFAVSIEIALDMEAKETSISKANIVQEKGKYYLVVEIEDNELTKLNEEGLKNNETAVTYLYRDGSANVATVTQGITASYDKSTNKVTIKCPVKKDDVISGVEYGVYLSKGLLVNADKTKCSSKMYETFTFMG